MPVTDWRAPVFRLLIPFTLGIFLYDRFAPARIVALAILASCLVAAMIAGSLPIQWRWRMRSLSGSMIGAGIVATGLFYASLRDVRNDSLWIGHQPITQQYWLIEFRKEADRTRTGWRIKADVISRSNDTATDLAKGGILIFTKDPKLATRALPGRKAWIQATLRKISNKPGSDFDYERYCLRNKITHQTFIRSTAQIEFLDAQADPIRIGLHRLRTTIRTILYDNLSDAANAGLSAALLVGWKGGLDPEIKQHYTRTGTVHIIAISGLHISLVFETLWLLLYPLLYLRGGRLIRTILALTSVWIFCFLAGGEASVLRAGIMFTAVHLGRWLQRPVTGEQALGSSMLLLLLADPDWLFDVGFQLSHGAVLGILAFQSIFSRSITLQNPLMKHIWTSASMTLAATIGTLPFTCLYFHQFPLLFLPANLIAVPLSSLALIGLFILLPLSAWPSAGNAISACLEVLLNGMNGWVDRLDRIPGMVWQW